MHFGSVEEFIREFEHIRPLLQEARAQVRCTRDRELAKEITAFEWLFSEETLRRIADTVKNADGSVDIPLGENGLAVMKMAREQSFK